MITRRTLVRSIPIGVATSATLLAEHKMGLPTFAQSPRQSSVQSDDSRSPHLSNHTYQWAFLYWMPYDNDLARFGESILGMLTRGTYDSNVVVAVQSDMRGEHTMQRHYMVNGVMTRVAPNAPTLDKTAFRKEQGDDSLSDNSLGENELGANSLGEDSSDSAALSAYLQWAQTTFKAEHWAVIVVGHGGRINQISPDDHSVFNTRRNIQRPRTWMGIEALAQAVGQLNDSLQGSSQGHVDLLFFQNCNKATLEVLYEVRHCAQYTLASQFALGAPNFYYEEVLKRLGQTPEAQAPSQESQESSQDAITDGYGAALAIMAAEALRMYQTLTLVDNQAIAQLPSYLAPLLQILKDNPTTINMRELPTYQYFGERHCDALDLLEQLVEASGQGSAELQSLSNFMMSSVISHCATGGHLYGSGALMRSQPDRFCGIGLFCPMAGEGDRYRSMALAQAIDLQILYGKIA